MYKLKIGSDGDNKSIILYYLKPHEGTEGRFRYNCNGLTFSGGAFSPDGEGVVDILKLFYKEINPATDKVKVGDIVAGYKLGVVIHSATIAKPVYGSGGYDPDFTLVDTKNGNMPRETMPILKMREVYKKDEIRDWRYYTRK